MASGTLRYALMAGLAIQYGLQTHFQHKYMGKEVSKLSVIFVCEVIKLAISACALLMEHFGARRRESKRKGKRMRKIKLSRFCAICIMMIQIEKRTFATFRNKISATEKVLIPGTSRSVRPNVCIFVIIFVVNIRPSFGRSLKYFFELNFKF